MSGCTLQYSIREFETDQFLSDLDKVFKKHNIESITPTTTKGYSFKMGYSNHNFGITGAEITGVGHEKLVLEGKIEKLETRIKQLESEKDTVPKDFNLSGINDKSRNEVNKAIQGELDAMTVPYYYPSKKPKLPPKVIKEREEENENN